MMVLNIDIMIEQIYWTCICMCTSILFNIFKSFPIASYYDFWKTLISKNLKTSIYTIIIIIISNTNTLKLLTMEYDSYQLYHGN